MTEIAENLVRLKKKFAGAYSGTSNIQEAIPLKRSESFPIDAEHLERLHLFASENPIYYNSYEENIGSTPCMVYEGDINRFWLSSIGHDSSRAPFSPTWALSAYVLSLLARGLGAKELVDVGSGDGRIAYCAKMLGMDAHSVEIDDALIALQEGICDSTGTGFNPNCADAVKFDYTSLGLSSPVFFIGGLAQMGGDMLARGLIEKISCDHILKRAATIAFTGTYSEKYPADGFGLAGWGRIITHHKMSVLKKVSLPTVWTFNEPDETPYIFAKFG